MRIIAGLVIILISIYYYITYIQKPKLIIEAFEKNQTIEIDSFMMVGDLSKKEGWIIDDVVGILGDRYFTKGGNIVPVSSCKIKKKEGI